MANQNRFLLSLLLVVLLPCFAYPASGDDGALSAYKGRYFAGAGDTQYLELLDMCARVFWPDPEYQNLSMLYSPTWNGFVEGPTWGAWWIQNSYGPTYCELPFLTEPYTTFLQNAQDLWFDQMGDGLRKGAFDWVAPDGCLCDAAAPGWIVYRQGDGRTDIHDWAVEFTAAGIVMQAELLLISRDVEAINHYLPLLRRSADFLESRRDSTNNLFLAGPAGNLLAPSYAGYHKPDDTYGMAYLAGLSITTIAALDRLIELEKLAGDPDHVATCERRRNLARQGLSELETDEGYFIKSLDPDGTRHGVYGAEKYGYFEAVCNHDAIAFRVVDDAQSRRIYDKIASIPGLRPVDLIITNYPSLDDMYMPAEGLWGFGTWVNGGHWTTCEARMMLAYFRLGQYADAQASMEYIRTLYETFRTDNPLVEFGAKPYQPSLPINCVYDTWGAPAGMLRGLFEYLYSAEGLTLVPHIPTGITQLEQRFPVRLGDKRLFLSTRGQGEITGVQVNGAPWKDFDATSVRLPADSLPAKAQVVILLGGAEAGLAKAVLPGSEPVLVPAPEDDFWDLTGYLPFASGNLLPLRLGADSSGACRLQGLMKRALVYERELTPEEVATLADPASEVPADGLLLHFDLGDYADGAVPNRASAAFFAEVRGEVELVDTPFGKALRLGQAGYLEVPFDPRLNLAGPYTLEAWVCPEQFAEGGSRLIDKVTAGVDDAYLFDTYPSASLRLITERGHLHFEAGLQLNTWVHLAATYNPEGELRLYVNGQLVASSPAAHVNLTTPVPWPKVGAFYQRLVGEGLSDTYEAAHARLLLDYVEAMHQRESLREAGILAPLPPESQLAADKSYVDAANRLVQGLAQHMQALESSKNPREAQLAAFWREALAD